MSQSRQSLSRDTCPQCGQSMSEVGKSRAAQSSDRGRTGHHGTVFECKNCERTYMRG